MSLTNSKISVVIPTWNRASSIGAAIESVLNQTYPVHEILVCDDGSTDNTREVVSTYKDSRICFLEGEHAGLPAVPRNRGIQMATGDWIAFLDSDDCWLPEKLSIQMHAIKKSGSDACSTNAWRVIPSNGRTLPYLQYDSSIIKMSDLLKVNWVICSSALVKRDIVLMCGGFPEDSRFRAIEDFALWLRVAASTDFVFCRDPLVDYLDVPSESVRANSKDAEQQEAVRLDYLRWAIKMGLKKDVIRDIKKSARRSMKVNGRSIWERIII
jgi:teichuronic acid biosynthesis glycosyltransferase TuaG